MRKMKLPRRIYDEIKLDGQPLYTLFDSGARNSYITRDAARRVAVKIQKLRYAYKTGLGGKKHFVRESANFEGTLHGLPLHMNAYVVDNLGLDENKRPLDLLFGMLSMEQWGVDLDLQNKKVDLTNFTKEFTEF